MNEYNYSITHHNGKENVIADQLSRCWKIKAETKKQEYVNLVYWASERSIKGEVSKDVKNRIVIDKSKAKEFLQRIHDLCGHRGISTMYYNLRKNIYLKKMAKCIKEVVKSCIICKRCKINAYKINKYNKIVANRKFERLSTDIYGPFDITHYKTDCLSETGYIITFTDIFTRYTRVFFYEKVTAQSVIQSLKNWSKQFSKPKFVISDNGKQYDNKYVRAYLKKKHIKQILVPEYTPSSNGISERLNKTITFILTANRGRSMVDITEMIEDNVNLNYNRAIKASPVSLVTSIDFYDVNSEHKHYSRPNVRQTFKTKFKKGDKVYVRDFRSGKLDPKFSLIPKKIIKVGKKGFWVLLEDNKVSTHVKNIESV